MSRQLMHVTAFERVDQDEDEAEFCVELRSSMCIIADLGGIISTAMLHDVSTEELVMLVESPSFPKPINQESCDPIETAVWIHWQSMLAIKRYARTRVLD